MKKLALWYLRQSRWRRIALEVGPIAAIAYGTAFLQEIVAESLKIDSLAAFAVVTVAMVGCVVAVTAIGLVFRGYVDSVQDERRRERTVLTAAHNLSDRWVVDEIQRQTGVATAAIKPGLLAPVDPVAAMSRLVEVAYQTLESQYGGPDSSGGRIEFEVTFMTRSYIDNKITIAAWANSAGRKPTSMNARASNPDVYETTVTAEIYRAQPPRHRIIENTADPQVTYQELYPDQKDRIKSSIVYPVLSSDYGLLGTLVLHCDYTGFFRHARDKFWREFCEVFAKRLALEKLLLDNALNGGGVVETANQGIKPF